MDTENELYKGLEAFIVYAESAIEHICLCYHNGGDDDFGKLAELIQQVSILYIARRCDRQRDHNNIRGFGVCTVNRKGGMNYMRTWTS